MANEAIRIDGLRQFSRNLKKLDADLPKVLRVALNESADLVIDTARPDVPKRSGQAARSMRAASTRTAVRVKAGGARAPHYPWLDFGGRVGKNRSVVRRFNSDGRYLYPTYFDLRDSGRIQDVLQRSLLDVARQSGVEVS